jgi:hypothetical protein
VAQKVHGVRSCGFFSRSSLFLKEMGTNIMCSYVVKMVDLSLASPQAALKVANAGLDWAYNHFEFVRDGETMTFNQALDKYKTHNFKTGVIKGTGAKPKFELKVPFLKSSRGLLQ